MKRLSDEDLEKAEGMAIAVGGVIVFALICIVAFAVGPYLVRLFQ
jgi:hypothetical protein